MPNLSPEQLQNAALIYRVGKSLGLGTRDIQIGLITAMQESGLRNLTYGDRDSQGLFQQRPSQGWGTVAQVTTPEYAANKFFTELKNLGDRRFDMSMTEAAQAVQRSAYPDAYAKHVGLIRSIYPEISSSPQRKQRPAGEEPPEPELDLGGPSSYEDQPTPGMDILGAQVNPILAAPQFGATDTGVASQGTEWGSIISPGTNEVIRDKMPVQKGVDAWRSSVVELASQYVGDPYVWGGAQPGGFDCSGLIQYVYSQLGIEMPRVSYQQANSGTRANLKSLRPGDLVAWDNSSRNNGADHIAIYAGDGKIIEAPRPGLGVRTRKLGSSEGAYGVRIERG